MFNNTLRRWCLVCLAICLMTACGKMPEELPGIETEHTVIMPEELPDIEAGNVEAVPEGEKENIKAPSKELVFEKREACLAGMSGDDVKRLNENIKTANLTLENGYLNDRLFERLSDPEDLYWNYFDEKGDILIGYALDGEDKSYRDSGMTYEEYAKQYGEPVIAYNRFDADNFIVLMEEMKGLLPNELLAKDFERLITLTGQAKETHDVTYVREIYHIVHDMDYFLLRYAPEDVAPYVKDYGTIATYYGALEVYR